MGLLRHVPRKPAPDIHVEVPSRARHDAGTGRIAWTPVDRRADKHNVYVCCHYLDAPRVVSAGLGIVGRSICGASLFRLQLLDRQLLGRSDGSNWWRSGYGSPATPPASPTRGPSHFAWARRGHPGEQPTTRGPDLFSTGGSRVDCLVLATASAVATLIFQSGFAARIRVGVNPGFHGLLQLAGYRKTYALAVCTQRAFPLHTATTDVAIIKTIASLR